MISACHYIKGCAGPNESLRLFYTVDPFRVLSYNKLNHGLLILVIFNMELLQEVTQPTRYFKSTVGFQIIKAPIIGARFYGFFIKSLNAVKRKIVRVSTVT